MVDNGTGQVALVDLFPADQLNTYFFTPDIGWGSPRPYVVSWEKKQISNGWWGSGFSAYVPIYANGNKNTAAVTVIYGKKPGGGFNTCVTKPFIMTDGIDFGYNALNGGPNYYDPATNTYGQLGFTEIYTNKWHGGSSKDKELGVYKFENSIVSVERPQFGHGKIFIDDLINHGYDVIFFDYAFSTDYMQRNAMLVASFIDHVNATKCSPEPLVLCGPSMGGQITRYALTWMEKNNRPHCVREWIAFDTPNKGATVPISLQLFCEFWSKYWYGVVSEMSKDNIKRKLSTTAARQLLANHYDAANYGQTQLRIDFMNELIALGSYPSRCRKIAVVNGSKDPGDKNGNSGDVFYKMEFPYWLSMAAGKNLSKRQRAACVQMHLMQGNLGSEGWFLHTGGGFIFGYKLVKSNGNGSGGYVPVNMPTQYANPADHVNGCHLTYDDLSQGYSFVSIADEKVKQTLIGGMQVMQGKGKVVFMPTMSTLDVGNGDFFSTNWSSDIRQTDIVDQGLTPFDAFYAPEANELHVEINSDNVAWVTKDMYANEQRFTALPFQVAAGAPVYSSFNMGHKYLLYSYNIEANAVGGNCTLWVNGNRKLNLNELSDPDNFDGKTYKVITPDCGSDCKIGQGGEFIIGDENQPINNKAIVYIRKGSTLELKSGSTLTIHNGSRLVIGPGAYLFVRPGATIDLKTASSVLEIQGELILMNNAEYKTIGDGYTLFKKVGTQQPVVDAGMGGKLTFEGNTSEKRLELAAGTVIEPAQGIEFTVRNATVYLGSVSQIIPRWSFTLDGAYIVGDATAYSSESTMALGFNIVDLADNDIHIGSANFSYLKVPLDFHTDANLQNLHLQGVDFDHCWISLYADEVELKLNSCSFSNGYYAVSCKTNSPSELTNCGFYTMTHGADIMAKDDSLVSWCQFSNCGSFALVLGSGSSSVHPTYTLRCNSFQNCSTVFSNGLVNMSKLWAHPAATSGAGGVANLHGGKNQWINSTISLQDAWNIQLKTGNNDFVRANNWGGKFLTGEINNPNINQAVLEIDDNAFVSMGAIAWSDLKHNINGNTVTTTYSGLTTNQAYLGCSGMGGVDGDGLAPVVTKQGITEPQQAEMTVYPNPATDLTTVVLSLPEDIVGCLTISDMTGKLLLNKETFRMAKGERQVPVNTADWAPGLYFIKLEADKVLLTRKLIIQH